MHHLTKPAFCIALLMAWRSPAILIAQSSIPDPVAEEGKESVQTGTSIAESRRRLNNLEQPVLQLAEKVRATEASLGKDHPDSLRQRADLRVLVQQTFAARQEIQRAELAEFTRRLQRMKQSMDARETIAEKIVDRRVEELLNPDVDWGSSISSASPPGVKSSVSRSSPEDRIQLLQCVDKLLKDLNEFQDRTPLKLLVEFKDKSVLQSTDDFKSAVSSLRDQVELNAPREKLNDCFASVSQHGGAFVLALSNVKSESAKAVLNEIADDIISLERFVKSAAAASSELVEWSAGSIRADVTPIDEKHFSYIPWKTPKNSPSLEISPTAWGESVHGLRMALAVTDGPRKLPGMQQLHLVVQNLSSGPIQVSDTGWASSFGMAIHVTRNSGEQVETLRPEKKIVFDFASGSHLLDPGETVVLATALIGLGTESNPNNSADLLISDHRPQTNGNRTWYIVGTSVKVPRDAGLNKEFRLHTGKTSLEFPNTTEGMHDSEKNGRISLPPQ